VGYETLKGGNLRPVDLPLLNFHDDGTAADACDNIWPIPIDEVWRLEPSFNACAHVVALRKKLKRLGPNDIVMLGRGEIGAHRYSRGGISFYLKSSQGSIPQTCCISNIYINVQILQNI